MYSRSVSSFCVELSSCRFDGCRTATKISIKKSKNSDKFIEIFSIPLSVFLLFDKGFIKNSITKMYDVF